MDDSAEMSENEEYMERLNLLTSANRLINFLETYSADDVLERHLDSGRLALEDLKTLSNKYSPSVNDQSDEMIDDSNETPEETESMKCDNFKAILKSELTYKWEKLDKTQKMKTLFIFKHLGIEFNNPDENNVELPVHYISTNVHKDCRKYFIKGDDYYYDFFDYVIDFQKDFCLSVGSCSFYPIKQIDTFRYDIYMRYLNKTYGIMKNKGLIFAPKMRKVFSKNDEKYNIEEVIDSTWKFKTGDEYNCIHVWESFKYYNDNFDADIFKVIFDQAMRITNMKNGDYCILKFGQFQKIFGFLMRMKLSVGERWKQVKLFSGYVSKAIFNCFYGSDSCNIKYTFIIDTFHQIVIFKADGKHGDSCKEMNKRSGYPVFRNLYIEGSRDINETNTLIKIKYRTCYLSCVSQLGYVPCVHMLVNWRKKFHRRT